MNIYIKNLQISFNLFLLLLMFSFSNTLSADPLNSDDVAEAKTILQQYFDALIVGNTEEIKTLIGGTLLDNQITRLSNPAYGTFLQQHYAGSTFEIVKSTISGSEVQLNAVITKPNDELKPTIKFHLIKTVDANQSSFSINKETKLN